LGIIHFHDQFVVWLVIDYHHGFLRMMNVPQDPLAALIEGSAVMTPGTLFLAS
jgi:hypothetical protein